MRKWESEKVGKMVSHCFYLFDKQNPNIKLDSEIMNKTSESLLIIFAKNPIIGKVKTRLAKKLGDEKTLQIYRGLLHYTEKVVYSLKNSDKVVFYSDSVEENDLWDKDVYEKCCQEGNDLGERMMGAFSYGFQNQYKKVVIIGTDCSELKTEMLKEAFKALETYDIVLGPAKDGGYYLLGMKKLHASFFINKKWGFDNVWLDTFLDIQNEGLSYRFLKPLSDIDEEKDLVSATSTTL